MTRHDAYWLGYHHGRRLAADTSTDREPALKLELRLVGHGRHRAGLLGELRGYRQALAAPRPAPDPVWRIER